MMANGAPTSFIDENVAPVRSTSLLLVLMTNVDVCNVQEKGAL